LFSWKASFEKINSEYETVLKKRQALNNLYNSGRISRFTFELFDKEMEEALTEIEKKKNILLEKMAAKFKEVEEQIRILERLLANYEIQYVGGEISEEDYQREIALLSMGLENARKELGIIKETMDRLTSDAKTVEVKTEAEPQTGNASETLTVEAKTEGQNLGN